MIGKCVKDVLLISVGLEGSRDLEDAERISREIGLPFRAETYTISDVEETLPKVLWLIEEANALRAAICIPEFWLAEKSFKMGYRAIFSGQGSDELFAGYHKYLRSYSESFSAVEENLYYDTLRLHENSLEPKEKIYTFHNVEVRFPYVDYDLASFALSLPVTLKISSSNDPLRKRILRKLAEYIGLPLEVYLKPKKAIQYGTGVSQALRKIAKKNGLNVQSLINQVFKGIEWFK
jgi:asparagine synthase (glutamine-hydrolysing)